MTIFYTHYELMDMVMIVFIYLIFFGDYWAGVGLGFYTCEELDRHSKRRATLICQRIGSCRNSLFRIITTNRILQYKTYVLLWIMHLRRSPRVQLWRCNTSCSVYHRVCENVR